MAKDVYDLMSGVAYGEQTELETSEREKYEKAWALPGYAAVSPGFNLLPAFMSMMRPYLKPGMWLCDYGAGSGQVALWLHWWGLEVVLFDITDRGLATNVRFRLANRFLQGSLWNPNDLAGAEFDLGFCADVMEHIPTKMVDMVLHNVMNRTDMVWFNISLKPDVMGEQIGEELHLTVKPFRWWLDKLKQYGHVSDARHLLNSGIYVVWNKEHHESRRRKRAERAIKQVEMDRLYNEANPTTQSGELPILGRTVKISLAEARRRFG